MKRICFLCSDAVMTRRVVAVLRAAGVDDSSLMLVARKDVRVDELAGAGVEGTDAIPGFARGLAGGAVVGSLAGLATLSFEELGLALGGAAIPFFGLLGVAVGGLAGFLAGASVPSSRLKRFQHAIEHEGKMLLMLDVQKARGEELEQRVKEDVPDIEFVGFEPRVPLVP